MTIAESLKRFRKEFNLTQQQLADKLEISQQSYQAYESKSTPSAAVIVKLAQAFNVSTDYLLGLTDTPQNPNISDADRKLVEASIAYERALKDACKERGLL